MTIIDYALNGMVLVGFYYAATLLFGNELKTLISKSEA